MFYTFEDFMNSLVHLQITIENFFAVYIDSILFYLDFMDNANFKDSIHSMECFFFKMQYSNQTCKTNNKEEGDEHSENQYFH